MPLNPLLHPNLHQMFALCDVTPKPQLPAELPSCGARFESSLERARVHRCVELEERDFVSDEQLCRFTIDARAEEVSEVNVVGAYCVFL